MTDNKSKKGFVWSKTEQMKGARWAEYRQPPYDAEFRYDDYDKKTPHGKIDHIKPKSRSGSDNITNLQDLRWHTDSEKKQSEDEKIPPFKVKYITLVALNRCLKAWFAYAHFTIILSPFSKGLAT